MHLPLGLAVLVLEGRRLRSVDVSANLHHSIHRSTMYLPLGPSPDRLHYRCPPLLGGHPVWVGCTGGAAL
jgi:hypothetical protein